jgi:hypothetical protein
VLSRPPCSRSACNLALTIVSWTLGTGVLVAADPAPAIWRFDFGAAPDRASIPATLDVTDRYVASRDYAALVQPGWTPIHRWSDYSAEKGFGWLEKENRLDLPYERHAPDNPLFHSASTEPLYNLIVDGLCSRRGKGTKAPFRIDATPGTYRITIYFGDLGLGEPRGDMGALVNGQPVFAGIASPGGQVVVESRVVESKEPHLTVTFTIGDRGQTAVGGFTVERVDAAVQPAATVKLPPRADPEAMAKNLAAKLAADNANIDSVLTDLAAHGIPATAVGAGPSPTGTTKILATMYGDPSRLLSLAPNLDVSGQGQTLKRLGIDRVSVHSPAVAKTYRAQGLECIGSVHAEGFPPRAGQPVPQKLRKRDGSLVELPGFFSLFAPGNVAALAADWKRSFSVMQDTVDAVFVDEPRGMTFNGGLLGDYGPDALPAFRTWLAAHRPGQSQPTALPTPAFSQPYYEFFLFRLDAVPEFLAAIAKDAGMESVRLLPGNGELSPVSVNHSTFFPPAFATRGYEPGSWNYDAPWQGKRSAEVVAAVQREYGVNSAIYTSCGIDDVTNRMLSLAAISARPAVLGPREGTSFRLFLEVSAVARGLADAVHETPVHLYWPASITYPDLVEYTDVEGARWDALAKSLYDGNLDFKVTYRCDLPPESIIVYAPRKAVLSDDEVADLHGHLSRGGTLVYGSDGPLLRPDGTARGTPAEVFGGALERNIVIMKQPPTARDLRELVAARGMPQNPEGSSAAVKTFAFRQGDDRLVLALGSNREQPATLTLPQLARDRFTGAVLPAGQPIPVEPGFFRLVEIPAGPGKSEPSGRK